MRHCKRDGDMEILVRARELHLGLSTLASFRPCNTV
jgi:hypothetical protein